MKTSKPARYVVRSADGQHVAVETDSLDRARDYAENWARVSGGNYEVLDRGEDSASLYPGVVFTARPPGKEGTPLPRPQNAPDPGSFNPPGPYFDMSIG